MKLKSLILSSVVAASFFTFAGQADAASAKVHTVKTGESFYQIGQQYGVSVHNLMKTNQKSDSLLYIGEKLNIPASITASEKDLLARLVESEAKGEQYAGKVAVATVVLNRVHHHDFPNTIQSVIYQNGQFTPVDNGTINHPASKESIRAVNEALAFQSMSNGSLFFFNPKKAPNNAFLNSKQVVTKIGDHIFAK
jgi:N-acetylmuramoyl-L-alanine amidase